MSPFPGYNSLDELFERAIDLYKNTDCLGTRELLSEEDELQPSGKVFHKASTRISEPISIDFLVVHSFL